MKFDKTYSAKEIAQWIGAEYIGDGDQRFTGLNEIHKVEDGDIMFVDVKKYFKKAIQSAATGIIVNEKIEPISGKVFFIVEHPFQAYEKIGQRFYTYENLNSNIHPTAEIHPSVILEPGVRIAKNVKIGAHSVIQANTYIGSQTQIGANVWIQPNCTIGSEAFYFKKEEGRYQKWTSLGRVIIDDDVIIGANCGIDKGVSGDTWIKEGCRLDNLVHIGHGVVLGKNCLLAAQVGIGGKTIVGDNVTMYGQVGIANSLTIGEGAVILAQSGVSKSLKAGKTYFGTPAGLVKQRMKELAMMRRLVDNNK